MLLSFLKEQLAVAMQAVIIDPAKYHAPQAGAAGLMQHIPGRAQRFPPASIMVFSKLSPWLLCIVMAPGQPLVETG